MQKTYTGNKIMHFALPISQRLNKLIRSLRQKKFRDQNNMFLAEGEKLCLELLNSDFDPELIVIRSNPTSDLVEICENFSAKAVPIYTAPKLQFDQMSTSKTPEGILAVVHKQEREIDFEQPFLALDGISNPGNIGTIIRTAEWFGINHIFLGKDCADKYNPKVVRASMGSIFRSTIVHIDDLKTFIKNNYASFEIYGATLHAESELSKIKPKRKYGIIFGSESHGISQELEPIINKKFTIEGAGKNDSLNVAIAVGIVLYKFSQKS